MAAELLTFVSSAVTKFAEGLDLLEATAFRDTGNTRFEWFVHAVEPVLCIRVLRPEPALRFTYLPPELWSEAAADVRIYDARQSGKPEPVGDPTAGRRQTSCTVNDRVATITVCD